MADETIDPNAQISPMTAFLFSGTIAVLLAFTVPFLAKTGYGLFAGSKNGLFAYKTILWILMIVMVSWVLYTLFVLRPTAETDLEIDWINLGLAFLIPFMLVLTYAFYSMATYTDTTKIANLITTTLGAITKAANITVKVNQPAAQPLVVLENPTAPAAGGGRRSRKLKRRH